MSKTERRSTVSLEGRLLGFVFEGDKPKRIRFLTAEGERSVKLAKEARASIGEAMIPGAWIQVWVEQKASHAFKPLKLKASKISIVSSGKIVSPEANALPAAPTPQPVVQPRAASAKILVCQKSDCMKRGGKAVCRALETALSDRHLTDVNIQGTGCMKQCKAGPNIVFMPEKTRYSRVSACDVGALVDEHFPRVPHHETDSHTNS